MSASNSEDNPDHGQDTDDPLPNREDTNAAQPGDITEGYVPWFGLDHQMAGLIPGFQVVFYAGVFNLYFAIILFWTLIIRGLLILHRNFSEPPMERHLKERILHEYFPTKYLLRVLVSLANWAPLVGTCACLANKSRFNKLTSRAVIVIGLCLFGLLSWAYCVLVSSEKNMDSWVGVFLQAWSTGTVPKSFRGCAARVAPTRASLFEADIYNTQFARTMYIYSNSTLDKGVLYPIFDMERFRSIQVNQTLCSQGFQGNNDLYGLGIRTSLYLQWISTFLANNFLPGTRQELQKVYLIFSVAICLAVVITSSAKACVFSIEIEIMYWMYWGGYVCVFASAPCPVRLGSEIKWIKLDWTTTILFTTHALVLCHGVWFVYYAYDQAFARMPCGTYHFLVLLILDPSEGFWTLRDYLAHLLITFTPPLLATFPFVGLLLASEVKHTIQHSVIYQTLFPKSSVSDCDQPQTAEYDPYLETNLGLRVYLFIRDRYRECREIVGFPSYSRGGVRLVTPIDIRDRRLYRLKLAAVGLLFYVLSIVAIELMLKYNKVSGVYSIASTGQYVALIIGVGGFVSVIWTLVRQESERRRNLQRRQVANQDEDGIEMDSLSHNLKDALGHAFSQPDIGFSTNGGAFPITVDEEEEGVVRSLNTPRRSTNTQIFMSGALDVQPDLEAQTQATS